MPTTLEELARQTLFVIKEAASTKGLKIPDGWEHRRISTDNDIVPVLKVRNKRNQPTILIQDADAFEITSKFLQTHLQRHELNSFGMLLISERPEQFLKEFHHLSDMLDILPLKDFKRNPVYFLLRAFRQLQRKEEGEGKRIGQKTLQRLNQIFITLSSERDPKTLLSTILTESIELSQAEEGSLYLVHEIDHQMHFQARISQCTKTGMNFEAFKEKVPEDSLCGYVLHSGKLINVEDVRTLENQKLPVFNPSVDHSKADKTRSVITLPLNDSHGEITAILQLINKANFYSMPDEKLEEQERRAAHFDQEDESILSTFATQAAICIENVRLYGDIKNLFDGFVKASITAIEARDPSTGGHSERVAKMSVALAQATSECQDGIYRSVRFRPEEIQELEYAALLHDFGKIGVREEVLTKAKKLFPHQLQGIRDRFQIARSALKLSLAPSNKAQSKEVESEYAKKLKLYEQFLSIVETANEPTVLQKENQQFLRQILKEEVKLPDGTSLPLLTEEEYRILSISRGSLTETERLEIESHVRHTYQFLKMIPWTKDFKHLPDIAYGHHEKLDGSGYPRGLLAHEIPIQSKIMTIADIYDALTAADRWYKDAVPEERALAILAEEVAQGKIDPVLFELFKAKRIYQVNAPSKSKRKTG